MSDHHRSKSSRRRPPSSERLSELLDQLGPDHAPAPVVASGAGRRKRGYGAELRPVTNILRNPGEGFGPRTGLSQAAPAPLAPGHRSGPHTPAPMHRTPTPTPAPARATRAERPSAMAAAPMSPVAQGSEDWERGDALPVARPDATPIPERARAGIAERAFSGAANPAGSVNPQAVPSFPAHPGHRAEDPHAQAAAFAAIDALGAEAQAHPQAAVQRRGEIMAMFSARGGVGTTTIAINTAAHLAARGNEVCIVDLSLELGDVFVALDLEATTSIASVAREASRLDGSTLRRRLSRHASGVWCIGQEGNVDDLQGDLAQLLPAFFNLLASNFDYVIIDGLRRFDDHSVAALDIASQIHLVLGQDVMSVRRAGRAITLFRRLGYADSRLRLAVSRMRGNSQVNRYEIENALRVPVSATFRDDPRRVETALDAGALVSQLAKKGIAGDLEVFAGQLDDERKQTSARASSPASPGFFSRLFASMSALFSRKGTR